MKNKKIAIIGTVGIPALYGGFETLAECLTEYIGTKISFIVYCSSKVYPHKITQYNHAELKYIPLNANGIQSILYDMISLLNAASRCDVILILGVSGCIVLPFFRLFYPKKKLIINIDGLEHKREKWKKPARKFLKYSESLAVKYGDTIIADNKIIQDYLINEYKKPGKLIAYAGNHAKVLPLTSEIKEKYSIADHYALKVCRIEPENNIRLILEAFSENSFPLIIIGNWSHSRYGINLKKEFNLKGNIRLFDPIYDQNILNQIRSNCTVYIHGHSSGGTNPSLVEAMSLGLPIFAYDAQYNRETTLNQARYFNDMQSLLALLNDFSSEDLVKLGIKMKKIAEEKYTWEKIGNQYLNLFLE